jgi:hypothetical protein
VPSHTAALAKAYIKTRSGSFSNLYRREVSSRKSQALYTGKHHFLVIFPLRVGGFCYWVRDTPVHIRHREQVPSQAPSQVKYKVKTSTKLSRVLVVSKAFVESWPIVNRSETSRAPAHSLAVVVSSGLLVALRFFEDYYLAEDGYGCPPERGDGSLEHRRQEFENQLRE